MKPFRTWIEKLADENPVGLTLLVLLVASVVVSVLSFSFYGLEFYENILVEAHGMLFDLLIIGSLLFWLQSIGEKRRERRLNFQRYQEEIADYLGWQEPEATYRIVGNIKRLNREGISKINLVEAYLKKGVLDDVNLEGANLWAANLSEAYLNGANFRGADLSETDLSRARLRGADLRDASLGDANLRGAKIDETTKIDDKWRIVSRVVTQGAKGQNLSGLDFSGADLRKIDFSNANLSGVDLSYSFLDEADLIGADLSGANLNNVSLNGTLYDNETTIWPVNFDPKEAGAEGISIPF